jgi:hypothetical protein
MKFVLWSRVLFENQLVAELVIKYPAVRNFNGSFSSSQQAATEHVRFEVFTAVTMKDAVFWDIKPHLTGNT